MPSEADVEGAGEWLRLALLEPELERALDLFRRAAMLAPAAVATWEGLGLLLRRHGRAAEAARAYRRAATLAPADPRLYAELGRAERARGAARPATRALRVALALRPECGEDLFHLGLAQLDLLEHAEGIDTLRLARAVEPERFETHLNLIMQLGHCGRYEEAKAAIRVARGCPNPHNDHLALREAHLELARGRLPSAAAALAVAADGAERQTLAARCRLHAGIAEVAARPEVDEGLVIGAPVFDTSGYAYAARRLIERLVADGRRLWVIDRKGAAPPIGEGAWRLPPEAAGPVRARVHLEIGLPPTVERIPGLGLANFTMFEAARVPDHWIGNSLRHDLLIVPTGSSRQAWIEAGMPDERIALCPLGVDPAMKAPPLVVADNRGRRNADYRTRFLNISDLTVRKNLDGLLRVWLRATTARCDAVLVLKLGKGHADDRQLFTKLLAHAERRVGKGIGEAAPLFLVTGRLSDETIAQMFAASTHYWSMSHGEGWDLPMTQAGAMGLHPIAPAHSAYQEYLDADTATLLPVRRGPAIDLDGSPCVGFGGLDWWNACEDAAVEAVSAAIGGRLAPKSAAERLAGRFSWGKSAQRLQDIIAVFSAS